MKKLADAREEERKKKEKENADKEKLLHEVDVASK